MSLTAICNSVKLLTFYVLWDIANEVPRIPVERVSCMVERYIYPVEFFA